MADELTESTAEDERAAKREMEQRADYEQWVRVETARAEEIEARRDLLRHEVRVMELEPALSYRRLALDAAATFLAHEVDADSSVLLGVARECEAYLRGEQPSTPAAPPVGTYGWQRDSDGRIRHALMDGETDTDVAESLARKYARAPGYSLVIFDGERWMSALP